MPTESWIEPGPPGITRIGFRIDAADLPPPPPPSPHPRDLPPPQSWIEPGPPGITRIGFTLDGEAIRNAVEHQGEAR